MWASESKPSGGVTSTTAATTNIVATHRASGENSSSVVWSAFAGYVSLGAIGALVSYGLVMYLRGNENGASVHRTLNKNGVNSSSLNGVTVHSVLRSRRKAPVSTSAQEGEQPGTQTDEDMNLTGTESRLIPGKSSLLSARGSDAEKTTGGSSSLSSPHLRSQNSISQIGASVSGGSIAEKKVFSPRKSSFLSSAFEVDASHTASKSHNQSVVFANTVETSFSPTPAPAAQPAATLSSTKKSVRSARPGPSASPPSAYADQESHTPQPVPRQKTASPTPRVDRKAIKEESLPHPPPVHGRRISPSPAKNAIADVPHPKESIISARRVQGSVGPAPPSSSSAASKSPTKSTRQAAVTVATSVNETPRVATPSSDAESPSSEMMTYDDAAAFEAAAVSNNASQPKSIVRARPSARAESESPVPQASTETKPSVDPPTDDLQTTWIKERSSKKATPAKSTLASLSTSAERTRNITDQVAVKRISTASPPPQTASEGVKEVARVAEEEEEPPSVLSRLRNVRQLQRQADGSVTVGTEVNNTSILANTVDKSGKDSAALVAEAPSSSTPAPSSQASRFNLGWGWTKRKTTTDAEPEKKASVLSRWFGGGSVKSKSVCEDEDDDIEFMDHSTFAFNRFKKDLETNRVAPVKQAIAEMEQLAAQARAIRKQRAAKLERRSVSAAVVNNTDGSPSEQQEDSIASAVVDEEKVAAASLLGEREAELWGRVKDKARVADELLTQLIVAIDSAPVGNRDDLRSQRKDLVMSTSAYMEQIAPYLGHTLRKDRAGDVVLN